LARPKTPKRGSQKAPQRAFWTRSNAKQARTAATQLRRETPKRQSDSLLEPASWCGRIARKFKEHGSVPVSRFSTIADFSRANPYFPQLVRQAPAWQNSYARRKPQPPLRRLKFQCGRADGPYWHARPSAPLKGKQHFFILETGGNGPYSFLSPGPPPFNAFEHLRFGIRPFAASPRVQQL